MVLILGIQKTKKKTLWKDFNLNDLNLKKGNEKW